MKTKGITIAIWLCVGQMLHAASEFSDSPVATCDRASHGPNSPQTMFTESIQKKQNVSRTNQVDLHHLTKSNASYSCALNLGHLMAHQPNFFEQSSNVIDNLQAHLGRLRDVWPGMFENCLSVRIPNQSASDGVVTQGQYCIAYFLPPTLDEMTEDERNLFEGKKEASRYPIPILQTGLCVPDSCSATDVQELLKYFLKDDAPKYTIFVPEDYCQTDKPKPVPLVTKVIGAGIIIIVTLAILGTILEVSEFKMKSKYANKKKKDETTSSPPQNKGSLIRSVVKCFSLFSNSWFLFKMDAVIPGEMDTFHGVRFASNVGIQIVHIISVGNFNGWNNMQDHPFIMSISSVGFYYVQLLLQVMVVMSGAGITMSALHRIQKKDKRFNLLAFYLRRLWRLSVPYYITVALIIGVVPYLGSGPKWPDVEHESTTCKDVWWANIFYVNNYISDPMCQIHTWYLSTDVQLMLIAPLFVLSFNRSFRLGLTLVVTTICYSVGKMFYYAYVHSMNPLTLSIDPKLSKTMVYFRNLYFLPYSRIGCYCVGITMGYLVHTYGKSLRIKPFLRWWAPVVATVFIFSPTWLWYRYENIKYPAPTQLESAICESIYRIQFSLSCAYMFISMHTGYQDIFTRGFRSLFSRKVYVLTSKLHYAYFLLHVIVTQSFISSRPQPMEFTTLNFSLLIVGLMASIYFLAIPFTLLFVYPFARLEKIIEEKLTKRKTE